MSLFLVRHAEAAEDSEGAILSGNDGPPLTIEGLSQAHRLGKLLVAHPTLRPLRLYCSPAERSRKTAIILAHYLQVPAKEKEALAEMNFGKFIGLTPAQARESYPKEFPLWWDQPSLHPPPEGESLGEVWDRVNPLLREDDGLMLVTHLYVIRAILCRLLSLPLTMARIFSVPVASCTVVTDLRLAGFVDGRFGD